MQNQTHKFVNGLRFRYNRRVGERERDEEEETKNRNEKDSKQ